MAEQANEQKLTLAEVLDALFEKPETTGQIWDWLTENQADGLVEAVKSMGKIVKDSSSTVAVGFYLTDSEATYRQVKEIADTFGIRLTEAVKCLMGLQDWPEVEGKYAAVLPEAIKDKKHLNIIVRLSESDNQKVEDMKKATLLAFREGLASMPAEIQASIPEPKVTTAAILDGKVTVYRATAEWRKAREAAA